MRGRVAFLRCDVTKEVVWGDIPTKRNCVCAPLVHKNGTYAMNSNGLICK